MSPLPLFHEAQTYLVCANLFGLRKPFSCSADLFYAARTFFPVLLIKQTVAYMETYFSLGLNCIMQPPSDGG
jgi:hypothetical protein